MTKKPQFDPTDMSDPAYDAAKDPSSPFYENDRAEIEQEPDPSDDGAYKVGPGRPPKEYMWKKGGPSPWPKGRPRKVATLKPDLKKALEDALNEKVKVKKGEHEIVLTKAIVGMQHLVNQFAKGDRHARRDVFEYSAVLGVDLQAKELIAGALGVNEQAIVDAFLRRQQQPSSAAPTDTHVKAPPDLLDDDAAKSEPSTTPAASPQSEKPAKTAPEPVLDENGEAVPVSDIRYIRAVRERHLAQEKKNQDRDP